jgi:hypothetical protein
LLHPKLIEFYLSLPLPEKRHEGAGRYLIRRYLARYLPASIFDNYQKKTGLNILAATMDDYQTKFSEGVFQSAFHELPYPELIQDKMEHMRMVKSVRAFMLKSRLGACFLTQHFLEESHRLYDRALFCALFYRLKAFEWPLFHR